MNDTLLNQAGIFMIYLLSGIFICLVYDIFRALRKTVKTADFVTLIEDVIFWLIVAIFLIYMIFIFGNGEIRLFMFVAICSGGTIYYLLISKYFMKISVSILTILKKVFVKIITLLMIPLKIFLKINRKISYIVCINFKNVEKNIKKIDKDRKMVKENRKKAKKLEIKWRNLDFFVE